jgi:hypothetical protein
MWTLVNSSFTATNEVGLDGTRGGLRLVGSSRVNGHYIALGKMASTTAPLWSTTALLSWAGVETTIRTAQPPPWSRAAREVDVARSRSLKRLYKSKEQRDVSGFERPQPARPAAQTARPAVIPSARRNGEPGRESRTGGSGVQVAPLFFCARTKKAPGMSPAPSTTPDLWSGMYLRRGPREGRAQTKYRGWKRFATFRTN